MKHSPGGRLFFLRSALALGLAGLAIASSSCGGKRKPVQPPVPATLGPDETEISSELEGVASFYGDPHQGRHTASGEIFDKHALTAAHRTLPFNTRVRVLNLENHRNVVVRINDRGPFIAGRIIDLSEEAGRQIGLAGPGTARVRLQILSSPVEQDVWYAVQVGAFSVRKNADQLRRQLDRRYDHVAVTAYDSGEETFYRVRVGAEPSLTKASRLARELQRENLPALVVRSDER